MQFEETTALEGVGDYGEVRWVAVGKGVEMEEGEEDVLVGVGGVGFRCQMEGERMDRGAMVGEVLEGRRGG